GEPAGSRTSGTPVPAHPAASRPGRGARAGRIDAGPTATGRGRADGAGPGAGATEPDRAGQHRADPQPGPPQRPEGARAASGPGGPGAVVVSTVVVPGSVRGIDCAVPTRTGNRPSL